MTVRTRAVLRSALAFLALILTLSPHCLADEQAKAADNQPQQINGTVVDEQGNPVAGANVWYPYAFLKQAIQRLEATATTNEVGEFTLNVPALKPNEVSARSTIWAWSPKHALASTRSIAVAKEPTDNQIVLPPATETSFVILNPDGNPVEGAIVEPVNYRNEIGYDLVPTAAQAIFKRRTDKDGRVQMPSMSRDRIFVVQVTADGYGLQTQQLNVHPDAKAERKIHLRPTCRIQGQLTAENPQWAQGLKIAVTTRAKFRGNGAQPGMPTKGMAYVFTDPAGRFVVPQIAAGLIEMFEVVLDEDLPVRPKLPGSKELTADETTIFEIPMQELVDIRGSILAADTDAPLPNMKIHVYYGTDRQGTDVVSDENGEFTARVLPGKVRFQPMNLSRTKYVQLGSPVPFNVPEDAEDFEAPPIKPVLTEPIDGRLLDRNESPIANAQVLAYYKNYLCSHAKTDKQGKFRLPKFPASVDADMATYRVELSVGETRYMKDGGVKITDADPLTICVKRE